MIRFAWRQQRVVILLWVAAVAAVIGYMLVVGLAYQHDAHILVTHRCLATSGPRPTFCVADTMALANDRRQLSYVAGMLYALPCLGGVVLGAPLVAGELERKTNRLAWTQGRSRTAWMLSKWAVAAAAVVVPMTVVAVIAAWWHVAVGQLDVIEPRYFDLTGFVVVAYALFALALGTVLGTLLRRTAAAGLAAVVGFGLFRWWIRDGVRSSYLAPAASTHPTPFGAPDFPGSAWWLSEGWASTVGASASKVQRVVDACTRRAFPPGSTDSPAEQARLGACATAHHVQSVIWYQPGSHFWPFQWIEAGIFVGAAVLFLGATVWLVRRWRA
ncbi:MAG TPA: ABC transporter permease subunit [Acidimicrobiales bacterium]|nr:ABC transporter permease subunit [Acidimicrobiales bacterium]